MDPMEELKKMFDAAKQRLTLSYFARREEEYLQRIEQLKEDIGRLTYQVGDAYDLGFDRGACGYKRLEKLRMEDLNTILANRR